MSIEHLQRTSDRGAATRGALLAAAREVFSVSGFAQAAVTDIVAKAGASVGSLYHHFSGKADLYLTLFEEFQNRQQERTREAVHLARDQGETDPMRLFIAGARAYLDGCLAEPDLARFATHMHFPIIPCDLCGSQEGLQRNAMKAMLEGFEKQMPGRKDVMIRALGNVRPSHLLDPKLFDFAALAPTER